MVWDSYYTEDVWSSHGVALASCLCACTFYEPYRDNLFLAIVVEIACVCECVVYGVFVGL